MAKLEENELRAALAAAKDADARRKYSNLLRPTDFAGRSQSLASQRKNHEELLASLLISAGRTVDELEEIRTQNQAETRRISQEQKASLVEHSSSVRESLHSSVVSQRNAREYLASLESGPLSPRSVDIVVLDTPMFVLPSQDINLHPVSIRPLNTVAKIDAEWSTPFPDNNVGDDLSFVFAWRKPSDAMAVVNVLSFLTVNGFCDVYASGPSLQDNRTGLGIGASIQPLLLGNQPPPIYPIYQPGQYADVADLYADGGGIFGLGDYESSGISGSYVVWYNELLMSPKEVAIFEVVLSIGHSIYYDGWIDVDFASGDFEVMCPAVEIVILS